MEAFERDFHDNSSSFDEILDFDPVIDDEENDRFSEPSDEDFYYRPLEEY